MGRICKKAQQATNTLKTDLGVDVRDLLYGTSFSRATMFSSHDATIGTLTQFFDELVLGIDNEGRVQSGEGVSLHICC